VSDKLQKLLLIVGAASFAFTLWLMAQAGAPEPTISAGGNALSRSAIGFKALAETLESVGIRVAAARHDSVARAAEDDAVLVLTDPPSEKQGVSALIEAATENEIRVLIVLPKWTGLADREHAGWLSHLSLKPIDEVGRSLESVAPTATVLRPPRLGAWSGLGSEQAPLLAAPQLIESESSGVEPLLSTDQGILFGRLRQNPSVYLLADPDLINNAGLAQAGNAHVFATLLRSELKAKLFVFDETLHGFERTPSLFYELTQFPLLLVTLHSCLLFLLAIWVASAQFGTRRDRPAERERGKQLLLENTVALLEQSRYLGPSLQRYLAMTLRRAARVVAPGSLEDQGMRARRLGVIAKARGVTRDIEALAAKVERAAARADVATVLQLSRELRAWSQELTGGSERS
jgi:hypothetical protein